MLRQGPDAKLSEELREHSGLVMGVQAAGIREHPGVTAAEGLVLKADAGILVAGDNAIRPDANKGDDGGSPAFDFRLEALTAGSQFVARQLIGAGGCALDDVRDAELEVEKQCFFKRRKESWRKAAAVQGRPKAIAGPTKVMADGRGVKAGVDPAEQHAQPRRDYVGDGLVARREELLARGGGGSVHLFRLESIHSRRNR